MGKFISYRFIRALKKFPKWCVCKDHRNRQSHRFQTNHRLQTESSGPIDCWFIGFRLLQQVHDGGTFLKNLVCVHVYEELLSFGLAGA